MDQPFTILFLSEHNARRGPLAAALANRIGNGLVKAFSTGLERCKIDQDVLDKLEAQGLQPAPGADKTVEEFSAEQFDLVIGLCDKSAAHAETLSDMDLIKWDEPESHKGDDLHQLEMELAERIRLMLLARKVI